MCENINKHMESTERVISTGQANPLEGTVYWNPAKSIWITSFTTIAIVGGALTFSWDAFLVFVVLSAVTICGGHSVGMHRLLIHRSFKTHVWVEHTLVYLGVLVGMAGPHGMIKLHDFRDWGQRQKNCHAFFSHTGGFWKDAWWQLHCSIKLNHEPKFIIEDNVSNDRFYKMIESTWMWQQLPLAIILFALGGLPWVVWGIVVRVSVSLIGHWLVGYYAHQPREQVLHVNNTAVQGYNLPKLGIITFGEAYHENHHAFPGSAKLGIMQGQVDLGWWLIKVLELMGLAEKINSPENLEIRQGLVANSKKCSNPLLWFSSLGIKT